VNCHHSRQQVWQQQGKRGVWLKVPRALSQLIPAAVDPAGFVFHHAEEVRGRPRRGGPVVRTALLLCARTLMGLARPVCVSPCTRQLVCLPACLRTDQHHAHYAIHRITS
jgi:hypothetical protein